MPDQSAGLEASTLWLALFVGLLVQGFVIYAAVRFALFHDRLMLIRQAAAEDEVSEVEEEV